MSLPFLIWDEAGLDGGDGQGVEYQGVEYLTVAFDVDVEGERYAAVVKAHLRRPAKGISADDVTVFGGERRTELAYQVAPLTDDNSFEVRFRERGDRAPYFVGLTSGGAHPLHPSRRAADFSFYIDCPAGDCRAGGELPPHELQKAPALDYLQKDYRGFVQTLAQWVRVKNPAWADLSDASLERVLIELLAHQADLLSYYQDRVANEAFLTTASQRYSLRQHATLLGYQPFDGRAARTTLAFRVTESGLVPRGLVVRMRHASDEASVVFTTAERVRVESHWSSLQVAAWPGASTARVPRGARRLLLYGWGSGLASGQRLAVAQGTFHQVVHLTEVSELEELGWVAVPTDDARAAPTELTLLRWREPLQAEVYPWASDGAGFMLCANLVDAVHGEPRTAWLKPPDEPTRETPRRDVVVTLDHRNSIVAPRRRGEQLIPLLRALQVPEGPVAFDRDGTGRDVPALTVMVDTRQWQRVETLHSSRSFDAHYTADADTDGRLWLRFGDGTKGMAIEIAPVAGGQAFGKPKVEIALRYRVAEPLAGNCAPDTLTEILPPAAGTAADELEALGQVTVTNVIPGVGGEPPESHQALRQTVPASLRHGEPRRAVALADYARAAMNADPRVARAVAKAVGGPFHTVLVLVDPEDQGVLDEDLRQAVHQHLDTVRMAGREHFVRAPSYVPLEVELSLCVGPGFLHHEVRDRVLRELRPGTGQRPGYFHPDRLTFGQDVALGGLLAFVQRLAGVRSVKALRFRRLLAVKSAPLCDRIELGPTEVARLDADENFPDHGVLKVLAVGLDPVATPLHQLDGPASRGASP